MKFVDKVNRYNKSFLHFLKESKNDFLLLEAKMDRDIVNYILNDPELTRKARLTFKTYKDEDSFEDEWTQIIDYAIKTGRFQLTTSQLLMAHNTIPMMIYNIFKNNRVL